jgi:hypothetical protein
LLLGQRSEPRIAEKVATALAAPVFQMLGGLVGRRSGWVGALAPIPAADVARALVNRALDLAPGAAGPPIVLEGWDLRPVI